MARHSVAVAVESVIPQGHWVVPGVAQPGTADAARAISGPARACRRASNFATAAGREPWAIQASCRPAIRVASPAPAADKISAVKGIQAVVPNSVDRPVAGRTFAPRAIRVVGKTSANSQIRLGQYIQVGRLVAAKVSASRVAADTRAAVAVVAVAIVVGTATTGAIPTTELVALTQEKAQCRWHCVLRCLG